jgi:hypothetical protein
VSAVAFPPLNSRSRERVVAPPPTAGAAPSGSKVRKTRSGIDVHDFASASLPAPVPPRAASTASSPAVPAEAVDGSRTDDQVVQIPAQTT